MAESQEDQDFDAIKPTLLAKGAGGALIGVGVFTVLLGAQTFSVVRLGLGIGIVLLMMFGLGVTAVFLGAKVARMRGWATIGGSATAGAIWLSGTIWFVVALLGGLVSLLAMMIPAAAFVATILCTIAIGPGRKADAARARLRESGLEAGA